MWTIHAAAMHAVEPCNNNKKTINGVEGREVNGDVVIVHPIYLIYDSGHTNIPQVLEIWPNIPIYRMQAGQQSKIPIYLVPTHVITIRYVIDLEYTRCDRIGIYPT